MRRPTALEGALLGVLTLALLGGLVLVLPPRGPDVPAPPAPPGTGQPASTPALAPLPRGYGVAVGFGRGRVDDLDLLGPVWYLDGGATGPDWAPHQRILQITQAGNLSDNALRRLVAAQPGHWWIIGQGAADPTRDSNPDVTTYSRFFAHATAIIRAADPTAGILPTAIVDADPTWAAAFRARYQALTGQPLSVDGWIIHGFLLDTSDPYDFYELKRRIEQFRAWMDASGEGQKPLVLSEFGVLYGAGCCARPIDGSRRGLDFMRLALEWLESSGAVASWGWFTLDSGERNYYGNLLRPLVPGTLSEFGQLYGTRAKEFTAP